MNRLWEEIIDNIDEKYIDETVDIHAKNAPKEVTLTEIKVEAPPPEKKVIRIFKTVAKIAAVFTVIIGAGSLLKLNNISISDLWANRPSEITESTDTTTPDIINVPDEITENTDITTPDIIDIPDEVYNLNKLSKDYFDNYNLTENPPVIHLDNNERCYFSLGDGTLLIYNTSLRGLESSNDILGTIKEKYGLSYKENTMELMWFKTSNSSTTPDRIVASFENEAGECDIYGISFKDFSFPTIEKLNDLYAYKGIYFEYEAENLGYNTRLDKNDYPYCVGKAWTRETGYPSYLEARTGSVYSLRLVKLAGGKASGFYIFGANAEITREDLAVQEPSEDFIRNWTKDAYPPRIVSLYENICFFRLGGVLFMYDLENKEMLRQMDIDYSLNTPEIQYYDFTTEFSEYTDENGGYIMIAEVDAPDLHDYYLINTEDMILEYIPDMSVYDGYEKNRGLSEIDGTVDGIMAEYIPSGDEITEGYAFLTLDPSNEMDITKLAIYSGNKLASFTNVCYPFENMAPVIQREDPGIIKAPPDDFLTDWNINENPPSVISRTSHSCYFRLGNMVYVYNIANHEKQHEWDIISTLNDSYNNEYNYISSVSEYRLPSGNEYHMIVRVITDNGSKAEYYRINTTDYGFDGYLEFVPDMKIYDSWIENAGQVNADPNKYPDCIDGTVAEYHPDQSSTKDSYAYLSIDNATKDSIQGFCINSGKIGGENHKFYPFENVEVVNKLPEGVYKTVIPEREFYENWNVTEAAPEIITRQGLSCYFRLGNMIFCYDMNYGQVDHAIDAMATLEQAGDIYSDEITVDEYSNETDREIIIGVKRKDNGAFDYYRIIGGEYPGEYFLEYIPDMNVYDGYEKNKGLIENKNALNGFIAQNIRDSEQYAYLTLYGDEIYNLCINTEKMPDTGKFYPFCDFKPIEPTDDEAYEAVTTVNHSINGLGNMSGIMYHDYVKNPPKVVFASGTSCQFVMGGVLFTSEYSGVDLLSSKGYDIVGTLREHYDLEYEDNFDVFYYNSEDWKVWGSKSITLVQLYRKSSGIADTYRIQNGNLSYFDDFASLENYYRYDIVENKRFDDSLGDTAVLNRQSDSYVYLRDSGLDYVNGIKRIEIVWRSGDDIRHKGLLFASYKTEEEPVAEEEDDANPSSLPSDNGPAFILDGVEYHYNIDEFLFSADFEGNIFGKKLDNSDYFLLKDGTLSETIDNINQLEEVFPEEISHNHKDARFFRYGSENGVIVVTPRNNIKIPVKVNGVTEWVDGYQYNGSHHFESNPISDYFSDDYKSILINDRDNLFNIDFLNVQQENRFNHAFVMLSGLYLNQNLPKENKLSNGYYLTEMRFYDCRDYFQTMFGYLTDNPTEDIYRLYNFLNINHCIAWKPYTVNPKYTSYTDIRFELTESTNTSVEFKAVVSFGEKTEEFTYKLYCSNNCWYIESFERWDGTVLTTYTDENGNTRLKVST